MENVFKDAICNLSHIEDVTLGADEEIYEIAGTVNGISLDGIYGGDRAKDGPLSCLVKTTIGQSTNRTTTSSWISLRMWPTIGSSILNCGNLPNDINYENYKNLIIILSLLLTSRRKRTMSAAL